MSCRSRYPLQEWREHVANEWPVCHNDRDVHRNHHSVARRDSRLAASRRLGGLFCWDDGSVEHFWTEETTMADLTVEMYDTTLRDGAQQEGMNLSVADKMAIAGLLDQLGVGVIEGGWPGAVPKDTEFFALVHKELTFEHAQFAAFGMTRRAGTTAANDPQVRALLDSEAPIITLVAKSDIRHVERALRVSGDENLRMIEETVAFLADEGRRVILDAEHFFDGYRFDADYAVTALLAAQAGGASALVLCDTNGGMLPDDVTSIVSDVASRTEAALGMHAHNDSGCAVANTMAAVAVGATHVQGCVNGYGERTGNADLVAVAADPTDADAEAIVKLRVGGDRRVTTVGEGNGPVNALDHALREALMSVYPEIERFELTDFKVRIMDASHGTDAVTRVLITTVETETGLSWRTVGVGPNVIEA